MLIRSPICSARWTKREFRANLVAKLMGGGRSGIATGGAHDVADHYPVEVLREPDAEHWHASRRRPASGSADCDPRSVDRAGAILPENFTEGIERRLTHVYDHAIKPQGRDGPLGRP